MTDQQHPATPPEELKQELWKTFHKESIIDVRKAWENSVVKTYHAGADAELEACCKALEDIWDRSYHDWTIADLLHELRAARRPKPPSLKEQALALISHDPENQPFLSEKGIAIIRRALEQLDD